MPGQKLGLYPVSQAELRAYIQQLDEKLLALGVQTAIQPNTDNLVARDLLPSTDMSASGSIEYFEQQIASGSYTQGNYSGTNPNDRLFAIYGVRQNAATPRTVKARFWAETGRTAVLDIWDLDKVNSYGAESEYTWISDFPIVYYPNRGFNIDQYGRSAGTDNLVYLGRVVEPRGKIVKGTTIP